MNKSTRRFLITPDDVKTYTTMSVNVHPDQIIPNIEYAEVLLSTYISDELMNKLRLEWINANYNHINLPDSTQSTDTIDYKTLYALCFDVLVWLTLAESVHSIAIKVEDAGILQNNTSYADNSGMDVINNTYARLKDRVEVYRNKLVIFVNNGAGAYQPSNTIIQQPTTRAAFGTILIKKNKC